jgi:cytochrome c553
MNVARYANYVLAAMAAAIVALVVIVSGVIPIQASSGHWRATAWLLDLIKRRSVTTYSLTVVPPPLDQPSWIIKGAAHFETGCRPCHGSPLSPRPPVVLRMTPHPPELSERIARWQTRHLFQIVKHGIKFTAMPAWAAPQRADEIWALVAFLQKLPSLDQESYRQLAFGETSTSDGVSVVERCARCHGQDGLGRNGSFPVLAGQRQEYLTSALLAYREDRRHSGIMRPEAFELDDRARGEVVRYFSSLPRTASSHPLDGRAPGLVMAGQPARDIPACSQCHGPGATDRNPAYPILDGQPADYLFEQLVLFAENRRGGSQFGPIMQMIAARLSPADMREAANYYSTR